MKIVNKVRNWTMFWVNQVFKFIISDTRQGLSRWASETLFPFINLKLTTKRHLLWSSLSNLSKKIISRESDVTSMLDVLLINFKELLATLRSWLKFFSCFMLIPVSISNSVGSLCSGKLSLLMFLVEKSISTVVESCGLQDFSFCR